MIAFLVMVPALLFMAGILAIAVVFAEGGDESMAQASAIRAERAVETYEGPPAQ